MWKLAKNRCLFKGINYLSTKKLVNVYSTTISTPNLFASQLKNRQENIFKNLQEVEQILQVPLNRFLTTNVFKSEYDILGFALKKSDILEEILNKTGYAGLNLMDKISQHSNLSNNSNNSLEDLRIYSKYSEFTLGGIVLALLAKCLQTLPYYKPDNEALQESKLSKQLSFAESFELFDKAIYVHQHAVMNFPLDKLNELSDDSQNNKKTKKNLSLNFESMNKQQKDICNEVNNCNKLSILSGDYLFSYSIINIANKVNKANAFDFVGAAIDDYVMNQFKTESEIKESSDFYDQYNLPTESVNMADYEINSGHGANGLLAFSAQYIAKLSDLTTIQIEKICYQLGWNLRIKWNVSVKFKFFNFKLV